MTVPSETEAPVATAPEESAPADLSAYRNAIDAYEAYSFPASEETAPETEAAPSETQEAPDNEQETQAEAQAEEPAAEPAGETDEQQALDDLSEDELERVLRHPKGQERLNRLVQNKYGNDLQRIRAEAQREARAAIERESEQWKQADEYYAKLQDDDAFYRASVGKHGEAGVLRWIADYKEALSARQAQSGREAVDTEALQAEYAEAFNNAAVEQFKDIAKRSLPFYGDLPDEIRTKLERLSYEADGNWLADGFVTLAEGMTKHLAKVEKQHKDALAEAREAGRNEAIAGREESQPVVFDPKPGDYKTWQEVEVAYSNGQMRRDEFHRQMSRFGKDI